MQTFLSTAMWRRLMYLLGCAFLATTLFMTLTGANATETVTELEWDALIPPDWNPDTQIEQMSSAKIDQLLSDDPEAAQKILDEINAFNAAAPIVEELNDKLVKIPGFILPLDFESTSVSEFLLVPYVGACIHVPPPPANQMLYAKAEQAVEVTGLYDPVWITGKITTVSVNSELGDAGYTIDVQQVEPYEW